MRGWGGKGKWEWKCWLKPWGEITSALSSRLVFHSALSEEEVRGSPGQSHFYLPSYFVAASPLATLSPGPLQTASLVQNTNLTRLRRVRLRPGRVSQVTNRHMALQRLCDTLPCLHSVVQCTQKAIECTLFVWKRFLSHRTTPMECCHILIQSWLFMAYMFCCSTNKGVTLCKSPNFLFSAHFSHTC